MQSMPMRTASLLLLCAGCSSTIPTGGVFASEPKRSERLTIRFESQNEDAQATAARHPAVGNVLPNRKSPSRLASGSAIESSAQQAARTVPNAPYSTFKDAVASRTGHRVSDHQAADQGPAFRRFVNQQPIQLASDDSTLIDSTLIPFERVVEAPEVELSGEPDLVSLVATGADLLAVLRMIADHHHLNLVVGPDVSGPVTVNIRKARLDEVLDAILGVAGYSWHRVDHLLYVTGGSTAGMDPRVQGRTVQVYSLDYVSAVDVEGVANALLSPAGSAFISEAEDANQLRTQELLVVDDIQAAHHRIAQYIAQVDIAPKQVLVEAHVLQIALSDEDRHGINLQALARIDGSKITLAGSGFASDGNGEPRLSIRVDGSDMNSLIELIHQHTNSRTLASPKLAVVNHQQAHLQIGQRLPYTVATTTQTTTVQSVEFLEVGIVLTVRPVITGDGNVLMTVLPKVSGGKITELGFPEEDTTEVATTVLIPDGGGIIIGGLIREDNVQARSFVPGLSRVPLIGRLFKRRSDETRRNEVVVALVTHVIHGQCGQREHEVLELHRAIPPYAAAHLGNRIMRQETLEGTVFHDVMIVE